MSERAPDRGNFHQNTGLRARSDFQTIPEHVRNAPERAYEAADLLKAAQYLQGAADAASVAHTSTVSLSVRSCLKLAAALELAAQRLDPDGTDARQLASQPVKPGKV